MHRSIATSLAAAAGVAAGGTPLPAQETGVVRGAVTLEENGDGRLLRRQLAGVRGPAAAARGAHPVVDGLQPDDALYRNHTSFIEDPAPAMGRGVRVSYAVRFH